ncbi:MAG: hypothetical protein JW984_06330 [Deltaproteobacteria bacterium]|uniref:Uncharacterized protein n=1 Tax=Candidatus Zymogenus saltonus TaxID=2844893 RepID=A0A9D8KE15_9DELT|nr:hypothetical protein [Candidatus Zymogenus saltonus]
MKIDPFRLWSAVGGRKFMALVIACIMELATGGISQNLLFVIITFMGANVVKDVGLNWMERRNEKVHDPGMGDPDPSFDRRDLPPGEDNSEIGE